MSEAVRARPAVSQQFGSAVVSDRSRSFQGIIQGDLHLNQPPERPETPPKPTAVIPFNREHDFVQRDTILDQVHQLCSEPASRTALVGLGGVGKSQIAIEYAYRVRNRSPDTWVFWVHASSAARYEQSFRDIADYLKLPERRNPQTNIFQLLYNWLRGEKSGQWVLILDNVDEAHFLFDNPVSRGDGQRNGSGDQNKPLVSYLPHCQHGSILITTRSKHEALTLAEERDIIAVGPMHQAEAIVLAQKKLGKLDKQGDIETLELLVQTLEYMPLAIVQATAYIAQRAPRCSVRQYLEKSTQSDRKRATLLDHEGGQLRRDREAENSIIITWQISFDHIRQTRPSAADLLSLMSFCDRQGIPETLLRASGRNDAPVYGPNGQTRSRTARVAMKNQLIKWCKGIIAGRMSLRRKPIDEDVEMDSSMDKQFEKDISILRDYSFISINEDGQTFEMHRLVQLATRRWLEAKGKQERWKSEFICCLDAQLPTGAYENWATCRELLPQAVSAAAQRPEDEASLERWASILYKAAWYLKMMGQGPEAQMMAKDAMKYRQEVLGPEHERTLDAKEMLQRLAKSVSRAHK